jgi:NitT/TauT family transport system permease protein
MKNFTLNNNYYKLASILFLLIVWKLISIIIGQEILVPSPESTFQSLLYIVGSEKFFIIIFNTVFRSLIGFIIALFFAVLLGVLSIIWSPLLYLFKPIVTITKATPTMAVILLALIWLKTNITPIFVGFLVIFPILYSNVIEGFLNVDKKLIEMADIYKVNKSRIFSNIYMPSIISYLFAGITTALGLNLKVNIAAEVLSQPKLSIGTSLYLEKINLNTEGVFAWTVIAIITASLFDFFLSIFQKKIHKWK